MRLRRVGYKAIGWTALAGAIALSALALTPSGPVPTVERDVTPSAPLSPAALYTEMRNVHLHLDRSTFMRLWLLRGQVLPTAPGTMVTLDDPRSFSIRVTAGTVALDGDALATLMNDVVFNYPGSPIRHLRIEIQDSVIVQHGIMHKGVDIPFSMTAVPKLMPDGTVQLRPLSMRIFGGVDGFKLLHALGLHLDKMLGGLHGAHGAFVQGDAISLEPTQILPPPTIQGRLASLHIDGGLLVQDFERTADDSMIAKRVQPDSGAKNYIYFRGGYLRFGKLTMTDTDLLIRDADESDPFDLMLSDYNEQLAAGETHNLPNYGLRTFMVDYDKLGKSKTGLIARRDSLK